MKQELKNYGKEEIATVRKAIIADQESDAKEI